MGTVGKKTENRGQKTEYQHPSSVLRPPSSGQRILITLTNSDRATLETLRTFFTATHGTLPVFIELDNDAGKRTIETSFRVDPEASIVASLESIVGQGAVKVL